MLSVFKEKNKSKMQKTKVYIFCFFLYSSWSKKQKDRKLMWNVENYITGDENFMKCVSPWTGFKVVQGWILRRGVNLGSQEIKDWLWCKSFFRFCVCFSILLCNLTMTVWMGFIGKKVKNRAVEVNVVGSCEG